MDLSKGRGQGTRLQAVMTNLAESLRLIALLIKPIMTKAPVEMFQQLGLDIDNSTMTKRAFGGYDWGNKVSETPTPIFPRLDNEIEVQYIKDQMAKAKPKKRRVGLRRRTVRAKTPRRP